MTTKKSSVSAYGHVVVHFLLGSTLTAYVHSTVAEATPLASTHRSLPAVVITSKPLMFQRSDVLTYTDDNGLVRKLHSHFRTSTPTTTGEKVKTLKQTAQSVKVNSSSSDSRRWFGRGSRFLCRTDQECESLTLSHSVGKEQNQPKAEARSNWEGSDDNAADDPWLELVGTKLPAVPLRQPAKTPTSEGHDTAPVRNVVRLPSRLRPNPQRVFNATKLHHLHKVHHRPSPSSTPATFHQDVHLYLDTRPAAVTSPRPIRSTTSRYRTTTLANVISPVQFTTPTSDSLLDTNSNAGVSNVHHTIVFKMLLLVAFIAVPILAATIPFLAPSMRTSRDRRDEDEALVDWAADTATLLALAHFLSDGRLDRLLRLTDDQFVDSLGGSVSNAMTGDKEDKAHQLKATIAGLIETVNKHLANKDSTADESSETSRATKSLFMDHLLTKGFQPLQKQLNLMK